MSADSKTTDKYREILKSNGILDPVASIIENDPGLRGQGGGSDRRHIIVKFEDTLLPDLHLFTKLEVAGNPSHLEMTRGLKAFEKEGVFLTKYVPAAIKLCEQNGLEDLMLTDMYPKCYYGDGGMLVMENLVVEKGYEIVGMQERHDLDTAKICLESIAKHHAISHAMIIETGGASKFFEKYYPLEEDGFSEEKWAAKMSSWMDGAWLANKKLLEANSSLNGAIEALEVMEKLETKKGSLAELWRSALIPEEGEFKVLKHGDVWYTNMMFLKDPSTGKIIRHKLLDFQLLSYNSPAIDVAYYLFTSVRTEVRQRNFQKLIRFYLEALQNVSSALGHPIEITEDALMLQFRKRYYTGAINSFATHYGPYMNIMKEMDPTTVDFADLGNVVVTKIENWVAQNPEASKTMTAEIISVVNELNHYEED